MDTIATKETGRAVAGTFMRLGIVGLCVLTGLCGCGKNAVQAEKEQEIAAEPTWPPQEGEVLSLFDGESMGQWKKTPFEQDGKSYVEEGKIVMTAGHDMSGITWTGPLLRMNYEIELEAARLEGSDFFCGLTFPVNDSHCTLVIGGWGGTLIGLSNIDYYDAANNMTTRSKDFENGVWYKIRLRVTASHIQAWIDDEMFVNFEWPGHKLDVRMEVDLSRPLGIATWQTTGAVRKITVRREDQPVEVEDPYAF
ncbi:MAG TPA: DUF1080 domain-containing protein [Anaerohalosphaeraceae bacterium]|jgi:hypothetical protein|nr:DUF1080 domain-containing protein [Anaerohalosphaeraceae bacterium]HRT50675.1 DUF1080 domain-containing protein [Anaerohalosphaeraceae bacterium]HRT86657.1 DUF1080 domain-containing protein [Anaerohalosphaeraceae bacterium]